MDDIKLALLGDKDATKRLAVAAWLAIMAGLLLTTWAL